MKRSLVTALLAILALSGCAAAEADPPVQDPALIEGILEDVRLGWEQGDGAPFHTQFLDWDGARYFEGGGQNVGLRDLVGELSGADRGLGSGLMVGLRRDALDDERHGP